MIRKFRIEPEKEDHRYKSFTPDGHDMTSAMQRQMVAKGGGQCRQESYKRNFAPKLLSENGSCFCISTLIFQDFIPIFQCVSDILANFLGLYRKTELIPVTTVKKSFDSVEN